MRKFILPSAMVLALSISNFAYSESNITASKLDLDDYDSCDTGDGTSSKDHSNETLDAFKARMENAIGCMMAKIGRARVGESLDNNEISDVNKKFEAFATAYNNAKKFGDSAFTDERIDNIEKARHSAVRALYVAHNQKDDILVRFAKMSKRIEDGKAAGELSTSEYDSLAAELATMKSDYEANVPTKYAEIRKYVKETLNPFSKKIYDDRRDTDGVAKKDWDRASSDVDEASRNLNVQLGQCISEKQAAGKEVSSGTIQSVLAVREKISELGADGELSADDNTSITSLIKSAKQALNKECK